MDFRVTFDLNDRTILITGSTGGLGRALGSALRTKAIIAAGVERQSLSCNVTI